MKVSHNLLNKIDYPNHHKSLFDNSLHIQSNKQIQKGDSVKAKDVYGRVKNYTVTKIIKVEPTNEEVFELNNNEGLYKKGITDYYYLEVKEVINV